ncbi:hypothetical protein SAMN02746041_02425 [Desulfacinum hydrothermale DSM 13146]|uniref:AMMECR1 domain-containing protein n=1 Tax=Desulfacinum hydrothermale DSM 13146 TaxID=1121390 RepID=A0A1W1XPI4_9BACT|nr:AmmeMemoRadiSam system protein A [Desulfacinum hydrothermale]SMC25762.1 hypothetical protein SAMN02746041_02425 [Desulfacinum hydrothermale DSM 13146]
MVEKRVRAGLDLGLSESEREELKRIALQALRHKLLGEESPRLRLDSHRLQEKRGAFVSLHKKGMLRGCIGYVEGRRPLWETVREAAVQAALSDPRFPPLRAEELPEVDLEISALTPLERMTDPMDFEVGRHGLVVRKGFMSGLLLPQVAVEHGWDKEQFLSWTCKKAGLSEDAWRRSGTEIYRFSADVF